MKTELEFKNFKLIEIKALDEPGTFKGYAGIFGNRDEYGDKSMPGMFTKTLKEHDNKVIFLDNHDENKRLGYGILSEDGKGLKIDKGVLNLKIQRGIDAWEEMKFYLENDMPLGSSFGYWTVKSDYETEKDGSPTRLLREVKLRDFSLATIPGNKKASITAVKSLVSSLTKEDAIELLTGAKSLLTPEEYKALLLEGAVTTSGRPSDGHPSEKIEAEWLKKQLEEIEKIRRR